MKTWFIISILALSGFLPASDLASAQQTATEDDADGLTALQEKYEEARAKMNQPVKQLNELYRKALERLLESKTSAGDLAGALLVKAELEAFGDGSAFNPEDLTERASDVVELKELQDKYVAERERFWNETRQDRERLEEGYLGVLSDLEKKLTRNGDVDRALAVRKIRDDLTAQRAVAARSNERASDPDSLNARIHFVAKGEIKLRLNGDDLKFRNQADDKAMYTESTIEGQVLKPGDILLVQMYSRWVWRSMIFAIESEDGSIVIPIKREHYHYVGAGVEDSKLGLEPEAIEQLAEKPAIGAADKHMTPMWEEKPVTDRSRSESAWVMIPSSSEWHTYAIILKKEMFVRMPKTVAVP